MPKFHTLTYNNMGKMKNNGVGYKTGENIVVHIASMLDSDSEYKYKNGKWYVRDLNIVNGKITKEKKFITLEEHHKKHYPKQNNPFEEMRKE